MILVLLFYLAGMLFTHRMIVASNIPDTPQEPAYLRGLPDPPHLSPLWAFIWPIFWLKTIPIFYELHCEEKKKTIKSDTGGRERCWNLMNKHHLSKALGIILGIIALFFALFFVASNKEIIFESESVLWVVIGKQEAATRVGVAPGPVVHIVEIARPDAPSCKTKLSLGHLDTEEWETIQIGDICYYPGEVLTFWEYYIMGKRPGPEDGFQIVGITEMVQWP